MKDSCFKSYLFKSSFIIVIISLLPSIQNSFLCKKFIFLLFLVSCTVFFNTQKSKYIYNILIIMNIYQFETCGSFSKHASNYILLMETYKHLQNILL